MTVSDLAEQIAEGEKPPRPASRREIARTLERIETSFEILFDGLALVLGLVQDARAVLEVDVDADGDDVSMPIGKDAGDANGEPAADAADVEASPS